jgi:hypothetical protein
VGEMDEGFFPAYWEDNDYHYRMNVLGIPAIVLPTAIFYHFGSRTQNLANETGQQMVNSPMFTKNREYMFEKWGSLKAEEIQNTHPFNNLNLSVKYTKQNPNA